MAAVLVPLADPSTAVAQRWLRPVPGEVARPFSYARAAPFAAGAHRGADLAAPRGTPVRAACSGRVVHAGPVAGHDDVASVRCGERRVSYLPLAAVAVPEGAAVRAGAPIGAVAAGHGGLHFGVRREGDPFGYEDPLALIGRPARRHAPLPRLRPKPAARSPMTRPARPRLAGRRSSRPRLARIPRPEPIGLDRRPAPAPWPVLAGLAAVLSGAAGSGTIAVRRRRLAAGHRVARADAAGQAS